MTCCVSSGTLNRTHSLSQSPKEQFTLQMITSNRSLNRSVQDDAMFNTCFSICIISLMCFQEALWCPYMIQ